MHKLLLFLWISLGWLCPSRGQLDTLRLEAQAFDRTVTIYLQDNAPGKAKESILYFTDGQKMIKNGFLEQLKALQDDKQMPPAYLVFVSTIDEATGIDYRNDYFFCNPDYLSFFERTLIPRVEKRLGRSFEPRERSLLGISFGGLNAAYFAAESRQFESYVLLSPVTYPCESLNTKVALSSRKNLNLFISTGTHDAEGYVKPLLALFESKNYRTRFLQTSGGHDFANWLGQMEEVMGFLVGK